jgi:hypothetical protein
MASLHEDLKREHEVKAGSERGFGLTVGGILLLIAAWWIWSDGADPIDAALVVIGSTLVVLGVVAPRLLAPLNRAWIRLGLLLGKVVSPIALGIIYGTTIVPIGLFMRLRGKDLLHLRRAPELSTYWISKDPPGPAPDTMPNQF